MKKVINFFYKLFVCFTSFFIDIFFTLCLTSSHVYITFVQDISYMLIFLCCCFKLHLSINFCYTLV